MLLRREGSSWSVWCLGCALGRTLLGLFKAIAIQDYWQQSCAALHFWMRVVQLSGFFGAGANIKDDDFAWDVQTEWGLFLCMLLYPCTPMCSSSSVLLRVSSLGWKQCPIKGILVPKQTLLFNYTDELHLCAANAVFITASLPSCFCKLVVKNSSWVCNGSGTKIGLTRALINISPSGVWVIPISWFPSDDASYPIRLFKLLCFNH